jgi:hypothetical protein
MTKRTVRNILYRLGVCLGIKKPKTDAVETGRPAGVPMELPFEPSKVHGTVWRNGLLLEFGNDYSFGTSSITFKFTTFDYDVILYQDARGNRYTIQNGKRSS